MKGRRIRRHHMTWHDISQLTKLPHLTSPHNQPHYCIAPCNRPHQNRSPHHHHAPAEGSRARKKKAGQACRAQTTPDSHYGRVVSHFPRIARRHCTDICPQRSRRFAAKREPSAPESRHAAARPHHPPRQYFCRPPSVISWENHTAHSSTCGPDPTGHSTTSDHPKNRLVVRPLRLDILLMSDLASPFLALFALLSRSILFSLSTGQVVSSAISTKSSLNSSGLWVKCLYNARHKLSRSSCNIAHIGLTSSGTSPRGSNT